MRLLLGSLALLAVSTSTAALADDASDIRKIEVKWGEAFRNADYAAIERIVAPEFKLLRAAGWDKVGFTPRAEWMVNAKRFTFHKYEVEVVDVAVTGNAAVATVKGRWRVSDRPEEAFVVTDTFVKRKGRWQAVFRHSTPFRDR